MRPPPPNPEDVRRYEEVLLPAYEARRGRLVANLESVEEELRTTLVELPSACCRTCWVSLVF